MNTGASIGVDVVRVFVTVAGEHGNLLGIVDGGAVPAEQRQPVATALGYSETVFVDDPAAGRLQIFTPATELPFAGHPTVGTAWWLRKQGYDADKLIVPAGELQVTYHEELTRVRARAEWAPDFQWHDMATEAAVEAADPASYTTGQHYVWAWQDEAAGRLRARMFAPGLGFAEDEATGAAAIGLTARLERSLDITQGRGSRITTDWLGDGWATVGGRIAEEQHRILQWADV